MTNLEYQLDCLYRLRDQLKDQIIKYPKQTSWIGQEVRRLEYDYWSTLTDAQKEWRLKNWR